MPSPERLDLVMFVNQLMQYDHSTNLLTSNSSLEFLEAMLHSMYLQKGKSNT